MYRQIITVSLTICLVCIGALPSFALPVQTTGSGSSVTVIARSANFDSIATYTNLDGYTEGNLTVSTPDYAFIAYSEYFPALVGFSRGFFYPSGGVTAPITISASDNARMFGVEFNAGSGFSSDPNVHFYWEAYDGAVMTGSGSITLVKGTVIGINDLAGFTKLLVGDPDFSFNALALDNLKVDLGGTPSVPEPSTFILVGAGIGGLALLRRKARK